MRPITFLRIVCLSSALAAMPVIASSASGTGTTSGQITPPDGYSVANEGVARGVVIFEDDSQPVVGATVMVTGTKIIVVTDIDGRFELKNLRPSDKTVTVSYVGMETKVVPLSANMTIVMTTRSEVMDEVLVVAFGKQKRESFTGSAGVLRKEDLEKRQVNNPISALGGMVAGVQMEEGNTLTGTPTIRIRGISSITAGKDPLIILDGLPYNGYWSDINPADIENITVLKDAASNALYGARGANGVILVTTKNGQKGKTSVTFNVKLGANTDGNIYYDVIDNPGEYYEMHYRALNNYYRNARGMSAYDAHVMANNTLGGPVSSGGLGYMVYTVPDGEYVIGSNGKLNPNAVLGNRVYHEGQYYTLYPDDWREHGLRTGLRQEYNANITGGNERYTFYGSLGYLNNESICYGSDVERISARIKTEYKAYEWATLGANAGYTHTDSNASNNSYATTRDMSPIYPLFIRDGEGNIMTDSHGPRYDYGEGDNAGMIRYVDQSSNTLQSDLLDVSKNSSNAFTINGYLNIDFLNDFRLTINGSTYITENRMVSAGNPFYPLSSQTSGSSVSTSHYRTTDVNYQQLLNYNHSFGLHNVSALLGHEYTRNTQTSLSGRKSKIASYNEDIELGSAIINGVISGSSSMYNVEGYFLRAQYDYDNKYFGSASFRRDGSSHFHPDHRWGNFWSLGAAWIMSKEPWMQPLSPVVNMLKMKASYGEQGNDDIGSFRYVDYYDLVNSNNQPAYVFSSKGNPDITWETVGSFNVGVEFELFNRALAGSIEYYDRRTTDMLMWFSTPHSLGYSGYYDNVGDMSNRGVEIDLTANIFKTRDFSWSVNANWTWQRNRVTYLPEEKKQAEYDGYRGYISGDMFIGEGLPYRTWRLPRYAGVNESGRPLWYYTQEDGTLATTDVYDNADDYLCGSALPDYYGGFGTSLSFKGFDLSMQFSYSIGGKKMDSAYMSLMASPVDSGTGYNIHRDQYNAWSESNPTSNIPRFQYNDYTNVNDSDRFLTDASWLTFKNINFGYTIPSALLKKLSVKSLRVFFACDNVYFWTKRAGFDPRKPYTTVSGSTATPIRTFTGGINVQF